MEGDAVLGFGFSGSHGSILPRHVQNRLPEHQSEQAQPRIDVTCGSSFIPWRSLSAFTLHRTGQRGVAERLTLSAPKPVSQSWSVSEIGCGGRARGEAEIKKRPPRGTPRFVPQLFLRDSGG